MQVWRICLKRFAEAAFLGEGARLYSGRWNPAGVPMVYTSTSLSLAAMEFFVHIEIGIEPANLVSVSAELPVDESELRQRGEELTANLPEDWRRLDHAALRQMGHDWVASGSSLAMMVPSVVIEGEWSLLINPNHPDVSRIKRAEPKPFHFDARMFRTRQQ
ncbi:RES family NAD+ phosphorylase [Granulicella aggregans]|uniref:RES family NAD+ phosphorylase n=1 Tax=Granulicella aggregans TaxID=474949 RepID=UPI0021DFACBD|nr:RES family NAD+ phosphorylase [Granulicella aggregans]